MKHAPLLHPLEYGVYLILRTLILALPHRWNRRLGKRLGRLAFYVSGSRSRTALANLEIAFPELSNNERRQIAKESFGHLGEQLLDTLSAERFDTAELCRRTTIEGWENLLAAEQRGRGVFVMSAHLGAWEAAALPVGLYRNSFHIINRRLDNPYLNAELLRLRQRFGNTMIDKRGATRQMLTELKANGRVGILIDQRVPPKQGEPIPFFGRPANTSLAMARIALKGEVPVVPIFGSFEPGGSYRVEFGELIEPVAAGDQPTHELTRRYLEVVEQKIRRQPGVWMWMHDRWGVTRRRKVAPVDQGKPADPREPAVQEEQADQGEQAAP